MSTTKKQPRTLGLKLRMMMGIKALEMGLVDLRGSLTPFLMKLLDEADLEVINKNCELELQDGKPPQHEYNEFDPLHHVIKDRKKERAFFLAVQEVLLQGIKDDFTDSSSEEDALNELGDLFGLTQVQKEIILLLYFLEEKPIQDISSMLITKWDHKLFFPEFASSVLGLSRGDINKALNWQGSLLEASIIESKPSGYKLNQLYYDFISSTDDDSFMDRLLVEEDCNIEGDLNDYFIETSELELMERLFHCPGSKILIDGQPGIGKTTLTKLLAKKNGFKLYSLPVHNMKGEADLHYRRARLTALKCIQPPEKAKLLVDEADNLLSLPSFLASPELDIKAQLNALIENLPWSTVFLLNDKRFLHKSTARRMNFLLSLPEPTREQRFIILKRALVRAKIPHTSDEAYALSAYPLTGGDMVKAIEDSQKLGGIDHFEFLKILNSILSNKVKYYGLSKENTLGLVSYSNKALLNASTQKGVYSEKV